MNLAKFIECLPLYTDGTVEFVCPVTNDVLLLGVKEATIVNGAIRVEASWVCAMRGNKWVEESEKVSYFHIGQIAHLCDPVKHNGGGKVFLFAKDDTKFYFYPPTSRGRRLTADMYTGVASLSDAQT